MCDKPGDEGKPGDGGKLEYGGKPGNGRDTTLG